MKKIVLATLVGAFAFVSASAQEIPERKHEGYCPHAKHRMHGKKQMPGVTLTEEQKAQFKSLNAEHRKQVEELKKQDNITVKESRERMEKLRKDHREKTQSLLTDEQKAQIKKNNEARKAAREEMAAKQKDRMKTRLGLSDEQSAKLEKQRKVTGEQMKAIRENKSLSDEQKREQMKDLHKKSREEMKSILTPEQIEKMKERKGDRKGERKAKPSLEKNVI
jgi:Spy/CpxP family protein refolding chaperone